MTFAGLQVRSLVTPSGEVEVSLSRAETRRPAEDEVVVRVDAAPINPSDLLVLFGPADLTTARYEGSGETAVLRATIPEAARGLVAARVGEPMPAGNEGAGLVVDAGEKARSLVGKTVAAVGGAMYGQYCVVSASKCLVLPEGATAVDGASAFVNPLTVLAMVETMRREGHTAIVHTAAASALGQMLQRLCNADGIGLVNVVRRPEQAAVLREIGAEHVVDSSSPSFEADLTDAIAATGATLAFDAIGGGRIGGQILSAMERALQRTTSTYFRYGNPRHKQVYVYGGLDTSPTEIVRDFGLTWGMAGWLVWPVLEKIGPAETKRLEARVAAELTTTFATRYAGELTLPELLQPEHVAKYAKRATGGKYLVRPNGA